MLSDDKPSPALIESSDTDDILTILLAEMSTMAEHGATADEERQALNVLRAPPESRSIDWLRSLAQEIYSPSTVDQVLVLKSELDALPDQDARKRVAHARLSRDDLLPRPRFRLEVAKHVTDRAQAKRLCELVRYDPARLHDALVSLWQEPPVTELDLWTRLFPSLELDILAAKDSVERVLFRFIGLLTYLATRSTRILQLLAQSPDGPHIQPIDSVNIPLGLLKAVVKPGSPLLTHHDDAVRALGKAGQLAYKLMIETTPDVAQPEPDTPFLELARLLDPLALRCCAQDALITAQRRCTADPSHNLELEALCSTLFVYGGAVDDEDAREAMQTDVASRFAMVEERVQQVPGESCAGECQPGIGYRYNNSSGPADLLILKAGTSAGIPSAAITSTVQLTERWPATEPVRVHDYELSAVMYATADGDDVLMRFIAPAPVLSDAVIARAIYVRSETRIRDAAWLHWATVRSSVDEST